MVAAFAAAIASAAKANPMGTGSVPVVPNRTLYADGDGLAYYCAGKDGSDVGEARAQLIDKLHAARRICGAARVVILLTASGSTKGDRYSVARVKPYQGQRANSRRPANWLALRQFMETGAVPFEVQITSNAEADDLFGWHAYNNPEDTVIYTQDKDMRMLPGIHLDWVSHTQHWVGHSYAPCRDKHRMYNIVANNSVHNDKQYGQRWFWLQMLQGDTADNIPGLPKYLARDTLKPVGEVTAEKLLAIPMIAGTYAETVAEYYKSFYKERWLVEMLEQACLLWMRRVPEDWDDCVNEGGPLAMFNDGSDTFMRAYAEIERRVLDARNINAIKGSTDSTDEGEASASAEQPLRIV